MRSNFFISFFLIACTASNLVAQRSPRPPAWFVQMTGLIARYHSAIEYQPGIGAGVSIGHLIQHHWLAATVSFEYAHTTQKLLLITGREETAVNIYRNLITLRAARALKHRRIFWYGGLQSGLSFFKPRPLTVDAGITGKMTLRPAGEKKIAVAWESGLNLYLREDAALLLAVRQNFSRFAFRQLGSNQITQQWRPEWNFAAGVLHRF